MLILMKIGGATGRVGDPSGRMTERKPADIKQVEDNVVKLTESIQFFFSRAQEYARGRLQEYDLPISPMRSPCVLSNLEWHEKFTMLDFLQYIGKHVRVNTMLNRERFAIRNFFLFCCLCFCLVSEPG